MSPTNKRIIHPLLRRALLLMTLIIVIALPCLAQSQISFVNRSASFAASPCTGAQLSAHRETEDNAMGGQRGVWYSFRNTSQSSCTLKGYPAVTLLDRAGHGLRRIHVKHNDEGETEVTLAPGEKAFFSIVYRSCEFLKGAGVRHRRPCTSSARIRIEAPGTHRAFTLREAIDPEASEGVTLSPVTNKNPTAP